MNLSRRFFLQNSLIVLLTMMVTALAVTIFVASYTKFYGPEAYAADLKRIFEIRAGFGEIKKKIPVNNAEEIFTKRYQDSLYAGVKAIGADAVVFRNRSVLFSTKKLQKIDVEKCLALSHAAIGNETLELEGTTYIFDRADLRLENGDDIVLILFAPEKIRTQFYQYLLLFTGVVFVLSFMGMNLWVSIAFSGRVIAPISRLNVAAAKISIGDLDCEIAEEGEGEVRELCRTLEQMRIKLKEAVYLQSKYDDNRKFLISSISHDLKTPVTSIKGYIEGIIDGVAKTPEKMEAYLETARSKTLLIDSMIDDLLLYSKLDLNQLPFNFERTNLVKYFEYCIDDCKLEFEKAGIKLRLINELEAVVFVLIDKERLKRVVQNILDNSKKYMAKNDGCVTVILRETRTSAIIEIKDNGRGIPEEELPYIFDRFFRADASRKSTDGSGLGLAIAKQIVEGHEGRIWAVSGEGKGTSIIISIKKYLSPTSTDAGEITALPSRTADGGEFTNEGS